MLCSFVRLEPGTSGAERHTQGAPCKALTVKQQVARVTQTGQNWADGFRGSGASDGVSLCD